ncbi:MAG: DUF6165 family protein [Verrucomicrobiota bacterium]
MEEVRRSNYPGTNRTRISIETGSGELIDKITILEIKSERISDEEKLENVRYELGVLSATRDRALPDSPELAALARELKEINESLWEIEDAIRLCEAEQDFGPRFVELARTVYMTNDKRAEAKKRINVLTGATIVEEKSYEQYG